MPPPIPQPTKKQQKNEQAALNALLGRFPGYKPYVGLIRAASRRWGIDPVYVLATLAWENSAAKTGIRNSAGARGLAQIVDTTLGRYNKQQFETFKRVFAPDGRITDARAFDPVFAINYLAWRMAGHIRAYGSLAAAYSKGYNPGFRGDARGAGPQAFVPSWYFALAKQPPAPIETAGKSVETSAAKAYLLQGVYFQQRWHNEIDPIYEAYTGRPATKAQAQQAIKLGWSAYHLQVVLSKTKAFLQSPVWKQNAPSYEGVYQSIYGPEAKPSTDLLRYAIIHNLGASGLQDMLRQGKGYVRSQEFKQNTEAMRNVYRSIFGNPDGEGERVIQQATLNGWNQDQFASYLRAQPEYSQSSEFRSKFADLPAVFGNVPTMSLEQALQPPPKLDTRLVPTDKRLAPA